MAALKETLSSIIRYASTNQLIVVGDRSDEPTRRTIHELFPSITYLQSRERSAVSKRNIGIRHASHEILVFIDDDVVVDCMWLENILRHYEDLWVGGVGGRVKVPGLSGGSSLFKTGTIQDGFVVGNWNPPISETFEVQHLLGCNMSFRKALVEKLGGFDTFFRSWNFREETDLCFKVKGLGYRILFDPEASVTHKAMGRRSQGPRWLFYYVRNSLYLYLKYSWRTGSSTTRFFHHLIFPPKRYAALSGVDVRITPITPIVAISGIIAGILGFLAHK